MVVSLSGYLIEENLEDFQKCVVEVESSSVEWIIIDLSNVCDIDRAFVPALTHFQKNIRERHIGIRVSGTSPEHLEYLRKYGILRESELTPDLRTALRSLLTQGGS